MLFRSEDAMRSWTLDGNDVILTVNWFSVGAPAAVAKDILTNVAGQLDGDGKIVETKVVLGGKEVAAFAIDVEVAGNPLSYRAVPVSCPKGCAVLMLQDSAKANEASDEMKIVLDLLARTFAIAAK